MFTVVHTEEEVLAARASAKKDEMRKIRAVAGELRKIDEEMERTVNNPDSIVDKIS